MNDLFSNPLELLFIIPTLLIAISVHEFAHAWTADRLGDPTPRIQGRLTLNPLAHLDFLGTLMLILFRFGWGKPVQFDPYNLEKPRRDAAIISFAGPLSNLLMAGAASIVAHLSLANQFNPFLTTFAILFIQYNLFLAVFNLVPIHPLDGGKILVGLLPPTRAHEVDRALNQYGFILLLALILPIFGQPLIWQILGPVLTILLHFLVPNGTFFT
ncbi:MAG: site-2 protease family protein [Patescibacteria group bacterium]